MWTKSPILGNAGNLKMKIHVSTIFLLGNNLFRQQLEHSWNELDENSFFFAEKTSLLTWISKVLSMMPIAQEMFQIHRDSTSENHGEIQS